MKTRSCIPEKKENDSSFHPTLFSIWSEKNQRQLPSILHFIHTQLSSPSPLHFPSRHELREKKQTSFHGIHFSRPLQDHLRLPSCCHMCEPFVSHLVGHVSNTRINNFLLVPKLASVPSGFSVILDFLFLWSFWQSALTRGYISFPYFADFFFRVFSPGASLLPVLFFFFFTFLWFRGISGPHPRTSFVI